MKTLSQQLYKQATLDIFGIENTLEHLRLAEEVSLMSEGKTLVRKNTGKFYTPREIALPLIEQALTMLGSDSKRRVLKIIDPFCGDGRLISWLLPNIKGFNADFELHIWDYDAEAVNAARTRIEKEIKNLKIKARVFSKKVDTFKEFFEGWQNSFDLVVTNPPWEVIKPNPKEMSLLSGQAKKERYIASLKDFSNRLLQDFPLSRPEKAYGGWGVNLARVGTELSVRLAKNRGIIAIVTPSTIFADQNSLQLRKWLFSENNLLSLNVYPAELKFFANVDQPSVSFVLEKGGHQRNLNISNYNKFSSPIKLQVENLDALLSSTNHVLPVSAVTNSTHLTILSSFANLPKLNDLEHKINLWIGRELDETNYKSWISIKGKTRFIKGRDIGRFHLVNNHGVYVNESALRSRIPTSIEYEKVVWRDVSRPNQKRRVVATIVPPGYVAGNSLGVLYVKNKDRQVLTALLGLLSSIVFEFQLRAYLATAHVSAGVMRQIRIPEWSDQLVELLSELTEKRLSGDTTAECQLEIQIAKAYGLQRDEFAELLNAFPKLSDYELHSLVDAHHWTT